jgi:hypothetical protein
MPSSQSSSLRRVARREIEGVIFTLGYSLISKNTESVVLKLNLTSQAMYYKVTIRRLRATNVAVEKQYVT